MRERNAIFIIDILKNIINVYFDTFFIFYFFRLAHYEILPLAQYYITLYFFVGIGFFMIRRHMKNNFKVPIFRIGIALQALYISLLMLLKEKIIDYIYLIGMVKGIADGFYFYPKNILDTEKIDNHDRQKYNGMISVINNILSIIIPLMLGILLTFFDYVSLGKIFFIFFIIMFLISYSLKDNHYKNDTIDFKKFFALFRQNENVKIALLEPLLSGITFSSGVMELIVTLFKIHHFKTNLNLGVIDSICALSSLIICATFAVKMKKKYFSKLMLVSGIIGFIALFLFSFMPGLTSLIIYLLIRYSFITSINLISNYTITNFSNSELSSDLKTEFYCVRDIFFSISRCTGYIILLLVGVFFGVNSIHYIMLLPAFSILIESIMIGKLCQKSN